MEEGKIKCVRCKSDRSVEDFIKEGKQLKTCLTCRNRNRESRLKNKCEHKKEKCKCKNCGGSQICEHNRAIYDCKNCRDPIKITIKQWVNDCRSSDKKYNRYDPDRFIDKCFLQGLVEDYPNCYYEDCQVQLQYVDYGDDLASIEWLDNSLGHVKSNCVLACLKCNNLKKSNQTTT